MTNAPAIFDAHASEYEALRRRRVAPYEAFDGAVAALALTDRPLRRILDGASYVAGDFGELPAGEWDAVVSALAVHHLDDDAKRDSRHERRAFKLGTNAQEWAAARERMLLDDRATAEQQLIWLREAGFADTDCIFKDHGFAVLVARRPG